MRSLAIISPHLDDAVLSVGGLMRSQSRRGVAVSVVTVFAGNESGQAAAGWWDAMCGFASQAEATLTRQEEDRQACARVGARPIWLPYSDDQYERGGSDAQIAADITTAVEDADVVLVPGFPLEHRDHAWVTHTVLNCNVVGRDRVGFYVEQPYASRASHAGRELPLSPAGASNGWRWEPQHRAPADLAAKLRAASAYRSQRAALGKRWLSRQTLFEMRHGGEMVAWP